VIYSTDMVGGNILRRMYLRFMDDEYSFCCLANRHNLETSQTGWREVSVMNAFCYGIGLDSVVRNTYCSILQPL